jgi:predicted nucleic acid-binding protein
MYLDSGIIVKLLVREPDSDWFDQHISGHSLESSELCLTEVCSALLAKERAGFIPTEQRRLAWVRFTELIEDDLLHLFPLDRRILERASAILQACPPQLALRSLDALHVATCDYHHCENLCATDKRMRGAATHLGIQVFPNKLEDIQSHG